MKNRIEILFSEDSLSFTDFIKISFKDYGNTQLYLILPIRVYNSFKRERTLLFKTSFTTILPDISILTKMSTYSYSAETLFEKFFPDTDFIKVIKEKAEKHLSFKIIEPTLIKETKYICGTEFISVDDNTSFHGNFTQDNTEGCHLSFEKRENYSISNLLNYNPEISSYKLPYRFSKDNVNFCNDFYVLSIEEKQKFIQDNLTIDEIVELYQKTLKEDANNLVEYYYPYQVRLQGNDDDSWTKYFTTEESMINEVYRLRRCQPINKDLDVHGAGYIFTN